jgi:hypothetical protein
VSGRHWQHLGAKAAPGLRGCGIQLEQELFNRKLSDFDLAI